MRLSKQREQTHFFQRLFLFNLIIVILVTFIPVVIYYQYFSKAFNEQLESINLQTVNQFRNTIDEQFLKDSIKLVQSSFVDLTQDDSLTKPMTDIIRNDSKAIRNVINQLESLESNLPNVSSIDVYYNKNNVLFYNSRFCFLSENACTTGSRKDWIEGFQKSEAQVSWLPPRPIEGAGSESVVTYVRSIPYFASPENRKAIIAINIYENTLRKALQTLRNPSNGLISIIDEQGNVIAHNQLNSDVKELKSDQKEWITKVVSSAKTGMFNEDIAGNSTMISYTKSAFNNWFYVSLVNKDAFYKKSTELRNRLMTVVLFFLLVSIIISYVLTRRAHKPIQSVIGDYSTQIVDLNQKVEINKPVIRHNYIMSLLHDEAANGYPLTYDLLKTEHYWVQFSSFVIQTPKLEQFENEQAASYHLIGLLEADEDQDSQIWAIKDYGKQIQGILFLNETTDAQAIIDRIVGHIEKIYDSGYVIAFGKTYAMGEKAISQSYREALEAIKYAYLYPRDRVLRFSDLKVTERQRDGGAITILNDIEDCIRICDGDKARLLLEKHMNEMMNGQFTVEYCKNVYVDAMITLRKTVEAMGLNAIQLFGYDIREKYKDYENITLVTAWTISLMEIAIAAIEERKLSFDHNIEMKIKTYIHEHLYDDISLDRVADELGIKPNYLGKLFKKSTGINFTEYLTACRLVEAEKLLKENHLSVNDIANKLGYSSTNHFIRIFKEKYGETPKKYQLLFK